MSSRSEMLDLLQSRKTLFTLPGRFYSDPAFYDLDLEHIFHRRWIFAGAVCEIEKPGQYFTLTIGRSPIIVLRDRAGEIRAFFNTCRHRGFKICDAERGKSLSLACPYHQWTYDLSGQLLCAGRMHEGFDPSGIALKPIHVATVEGTIFICLAEKAPDFEPYRAALEPYLRPHALANAKLAHEVSLIEKANWKLVMENSRECYHCGARHPELMRTFLDIYNARDPENDPMIGPFWAKIRAAGLECGAVNGEDFRITRLPFTEGAISTTMDGKPAVSRLLGNIPHGDIGSVRWVQYPSTFNHVLGDYAVLIRMLPLGPSETQFTAKWLVNREAEEGRDYNVQRLTEVWDETNRQDIALVERNQLGVNSFGYEPGPYSQETEGGVINFVEWYCHTMERELGGKRMRSPTLAAVGS
jgi:glycine betaine catabolism A